MKKPFFLLLSLVLLCGSAFPQMNFNTYYPVSENYGTRLNSVNYMYNSVLAAGDNGLLIMSTDDGVTWKKIQTGFSYNLNKIMNGSNAYTMYLACSEGRILKGLNSGSNWFEFITGVNSDLSSIVSYSYSNFIAAGTGGCIIASSDDGSTWWTVGSNTTKNLRCINYYYWGNYSYFYFCGDNGTVLKAKIHYNYPNSIMITDCSAPIQVNLNSTCIIDTNTIICAGDYGKIIRTTNQGSTWTESKTPVKTRLNDIRAVYKSYYSSYVLYACGENGIILRSEDNGLNWNIVPSGINEEFTSFYSNVLMSYGVTGGGRVYKCIKPVDLEGASYRYQTSFETKKIRTFIQNTGIFNQDLRTSNTPGFSWPKDSNRFAVFTQGLSIAAKFNGQLRTASASYSGEFILGSMNNEISVKYPYFMIYSVKRGDNYSNSISWSNWDKMVPYGAPYIDVNNNGIYEPIIDTPGVKNAYQTLFLAMTDGYSYTHSQSEGLPGGTQPLYADMILTAWSYESDSLADVQFLKYKIINKSNSIWDSVHFCFFTDADLGDASDDFIGCDVPRNLTFCYNSDNVDGTGHPPSYGINPPAVGFKFLQTPVIKSIQPPETLGMSSFCYHNKNISYTCEREPGLPGLVYKYLQGLKSDGSSWLDASKSPPVRTKYTFSGDPETNSGWTEAKGVIHNCGGDTTGNVVISPPGDRRFFMSTGSGKLQMYQGDTQTIVMAQMIKRGANNLNAVTKLKEYSDYVESFYNSNNHNQVIPFIPETYLLYQNYPNPFNVVTRITYQLNFATNVKLSVYDILGRNVATLVNQYHNPGLNVVIFEGSRFASGVYFYRLETDKFTDIKKMVLIK